MQKIYNILNFTEYFKLKKNYKENIDAALIDS